MKDKNVYSVGEINKYVRIMFEQDFLLQKLLVRGEVSNCKYHTSGHLYFTLKDETGSLNAVMFRSARSGLAFPMKDGDRVICDGSVSVYERDGKYQLYVRSIKRDGEGELFLRYEALRKELEEMGMFDLQYKQPIPKYAKRIGIVTASTGAAIRDIENIARRRNPYVELYLYPALVQGEYAAASIVRGIEYLDRLGLDVLIVGRGGGSMEDLFAFNEEPVVRAVFECRTPVISAVGHESDTVLTDFAADLRAPTPSAAAELAVFDARELMNRLQERGRVMERALLHRTAENKARLGKLEMALRSVGPENKLRQHKLLSDELYDRLNESITNYLSKRRSYLVDRKERLLRSTEELFSERKRRFALLAEKLTGVSPLRRISAGYAFLSGEDERQIKSAASLKPGDHIRAYLRDGAINATVDGIEETGYGREYEDA